MADDASAAERDQRRPWLIAIRAVISTMLLGVGDVRADHRARVVPGRSVLLPDRPDLRADDRLRG